jgi:hypothetical protein
MAMVVCHPFTDRASVQAAGWDVEVLVRRAAEVYLEMIFRDGIYHADPHPGNYPRAMNERTDLKGRVALAGRRGRDSYATAVTKPLRRPSRGRMKDAC